MSTLIVLEVGPSVTLQDLGRPGHADQGIPRSGALDPESLRLANRLVGNAEDAVGLEILLGGLRWRCDEPVTIALTGAAMRLLVDGREAPWGEAVGVRPGAEVQVLPGSGLRSWLAFSGGLRPDLLLESGATDTLSGLGPQPLEKDAQVEIGDQHDEVPPGAAVPRRAEATCELRVLPGPRYDWMGESGWQRLIDTAWQGSADSNRVGLRLSAQTSIERAEGYVDAELASEGIVLGAVQLPPSGHPVVFLADHPTTGGYPVVAVVHPDDVGRCAQVAPGGDVRFVAASRPAPRR